MSSIFSIVQKKYGTEDDRNPTMTKAANEATETLLKQIKEFPTAHQKSVLAVLETMSKAKGRAGNARLGRLTIPSVGIQLAAHLSKPAN